MSVPLLQRLRDKPERITVVPRARPSKKTIESISARLLNTVPIEITNAADWWASQTKGFEYNVAPPWPNFWVEFRDPFDPAARLGGQFCTWRNADTGTWVYAADYFLLVPWGVFAFGIETYLVDCEGKYPDEVPPGDQEFWVRSCAELFGETQAEFARGGDTGLFMLPPEGRELAHELASRICQATNAALTFAHAKGVSVKDVHPPHKVQLARQKKHKPPKITHKVLEIGGARIKGVGQGIGTKGKALHIARGHFATYSADAPLFGHYVGTVWKPMHVRGNKRHGEVIKQYEVHPNE